MRRKSGSNQHVQKNGVIYKGTAVRQIEEQKQEVVNQALVRLCKAKDKVWKNLMKELPKLVEDHHWKPTLSICKVAHSRHATAWAQARREIPCFGTTHADYFRGAIPVTEEMTHPEIASDYERRTRPVIARRFARIDPLAIRAVLVADTPLSAGPKTRPKPPTLRSCSKKSRDSLT